FPTWTWRGRASVRGAGRGRALDGGGLRRPRGNARAAGGATARQDHRRPSGPVPGHRRAQPLAPSRSRRRVDGGREERLTPTLAIVRTITTSAGDATRDSPDYRGLQPSATSASPASWQTRVASLLKLPQRSPG